MSFLQPTWLCRLSLLLTLCCLNTQAAFAAASHLRINEVMASNATTIPDEDGDYEDWIELYNAGSETIHLLGFGLSDDYGNPFRWVFPEISIDPGEYLLVWASGKNRNNPSQPLHTNFSISSAGEEVLITHPDGTLLDELEPTPIPTDISYGRQPDGLGPWMYFDEPTPGAANDTPGAYGLLDPPVFSLHGGFFQDDQLLLIEHGDPEAVIVYSLDGSEPCLENLQGTSYTYKNDYPFHPDDPFGVFLEHSYTSHLYGEGISLGDRSPEPDKLTRISATVQTPDYMPPDPVYKGQVVRARAFREGMLPSAIVTHSYFFHPDGAGRFSLPILSVAIQEDWLFDYHLGIYTPGLDADQWRLDNPGETFTWPYRGNFRRRGDEWEYRTHLELFEGPGKERSFSQDLGLRIHGGATRSFPAKSLRIYARNMYGSSHMVHHFFGGPSQAYKRLIVRNSGNDFPTSVWRPDHTSRTMFRDAAIQRIVGHMHFDTQAYRPVILFINGEYWGVHNIRERYDKHYLHRRYGVDEDQLDILTGKDEVKEGDNLHFRETIQYIENHGVVEDHHYQWVMTRMDTENFIDYQIANIFADNTDWPGNNIDFWRLRTATFDPSAPQGHDGRWRWLLFDMDFGFGLVPLGGGPAYAHNTLDFATTTEGSSWPNPPWSTFLLRSLLENEGFRHQFINRFADQLNTAFLPERTTSIIEEMQAAIAPEMAEHFTRWVYPEGLEEWSGHVEVMQRFALHRPLHQRLHIMEQFGLTGTVNVRVDVSNQLMGHVRVNTVDIRPGTPGVDDYPYPWQGKYFRSVPIELEAIPAPGYLFSHWEGSVQGTDAVAVIDLSSDVQVMAHFEKIDEPVLIHYWLFDTSIPNDTPLEWLDASYSPPGGAAIEYHSCLEGYPYDPSHPLWRKASMERRNQPAIINYRPEGNDGIPYSQANMRGLQVRQPFRDGNRENTMVWHLPTSGFTDIVLRFAARDEGAAGKLLVDYQWQDGQDQWTTEGMAESELSLHQAYQLYEVDFSPVPRAGNNPHFRVRVRFDGADMEADMGDRVSFNNISLDGVSLEAHTIHAVAGSNGSIFPSGRVAVHHGGDVPFMITPLPNHRVRALYVDGQERTDELHQVDEGLWQFTFEGIATDHHLHVSFVLKDEMIEQDDEGVLLYPNPANDRLHVATKDVQIERIRILGTGGRLFLDHGGLNTISYTLDTSVLRNGFYIVEIRTSKGRLARKLQVIR